MTCYRPVKYHDFSYMCCEVNLIIRYLAGVSCSLDEMFFQMDTFDVFQMNSSVEASVVKQFANWPPNSTVASSHRYHLRNCHINWCMVFMTLLSQIMTGGVTSTCIWEALPRLKFLKNHWIAASLGKLNHKLISKIQSIQIVRRMSKMA